MTPATHQAALQGGASAAAAWDAPLDNVLDVLAAALNGRVLIPLEIAVKLGHGRAELDADQFSQQELAWLRLLTSGSTIAQLAESCRCSERTVYRRLKRLYGRLGVRTRAEATAAATRWGLLGIEN